MKRIMLLSLVLSTSAYLPVGINATITMAAYFSDNMVLQCESEAPIWGVIEKGNDEIKVFCSWNKAVYTTKSDENGTWRVGVTTTSAGGPYTIMVSSGEERVEINDVLLGEVWVCSGQSNMEMTIRGVTNQPVAGALDILLNAKNDQIRLFRTQRNTSTIPLSTSSGEWKKADADGIKYITIVGYLYARILHENLNVPIGIIEASWGGSSIKPWMSKEALDVLGVKMPVSHKAFSESRRAAGSLFNGMIAPLVGYGVKGFLWYQGESNVMEPEAYKKFLPVMVKDWRTKWNNDSLAFFYVQIAPYSYSRHKDVNAALFREAQLQCLDLIPYSGMAFTIDIGEENCIHPAEKRTVAKRLACLALNKTYGMTAIPHSGPIYKAHTVKESKVQVTFHHARNGLTSYSQPIDAFEVAGRDSVFHPAQAVIKKSWIEVWSDEVKDPVSVRYAFKSWVKGEIYNNEGLPATSFRTDNWNLK